jgi:hypothetical protein
MILEAANANNLDKVEMNTISGIGTKRLDKRGLDMFQRVHCSVEML